MRSWIILSLVFISFRAVNIHAQTIEAGEISWVEGSVKVEYPSQPQIDGKIGMKININATIMTGDNSKAVIKFSDGTILSIAPRTKILIESLIKDADKREASVLAFFGKLRAIVKKQVSTKSKFEFKSKTAIAGVRGTHLAMDVEEDGSTKVMLLSGFVGVFNRDKMDLPEIMLTEGTFSEIKEGMPPSPPQPLTPEMLKDIYANTSMMAFVKSGIKETAMKSGGIFIETKAISGNFEEVLALSLREASSEEITKPGSFSQGLTEPLREQDIQGVVAPQDFTGNVNTRKVDVNVFIDLNNY